MIEQSSLHGERMLVQQQQDTAAGRIGQRGEPVEDGRGALIHPYSRIKGYMIQDPGRKRTAAPASPRHRLDGGRGDACRV